MDGLICTFCLWDINIIRERVFASFLPNGPNYPDMELNLKRCFTFLSLFPKGRNYNPNEVINFWCSQKFVESTAYVPGERKAIWLRVSFPIWNRVVDKIFGPVIESLSSRRWLMEVLYEYDIDDVLDEWEYQKTLLEKSTKWKKFLHSSLQMFEVKYYQPLAHEIKEISNYLQFIAKAKEICNMEAVKSHSLGDSASEIYGRIYGRDDVLLLITTALLWQR